MTAAVIAAAALLYLLAAAGYVAAFVRPALTRTARLAFALVVAAFVVHGVGIGVGCAETAGSHLLGLGGALGLAGWVTAGVFLVAQRAFRKAAAGVFALPLVLVATLVSAGASGPPGGDAGAVLAAVPTVGVHILAAAGGIALFALAGAFAVMFLLQQRELKGKRFGPLLSRLPSLGAMDRVNGWLVAAGFGVFSVALASGVLLARSAWCDAWGWDGQQVASLLVWLALGALVLARVTGTHGRRQATLTVAAFTLALAWLVGVRQVEATRHAGFDTAPIVACADPRGS